MSTWQWQQTIAQFTPHSIAPVLSPPLMANVRTTDPLFVHCTLSDTASRLRPQDLQSQCARSDSHEAPTAAREAASGGLCHPLPLPAEADLHPLPTAVPCGGLAEGGRVC